MPNVMKAAEAAKDVKAKVMILMHFGLAEGKPEDAVNVKKMVEGIIPIVIKVEEQ